MFIDQGCPSKPYGLVASRAAIPNRPKEEDYFYANPQECLHGPNMLQTLWACHLLALLPYFLQIGMIEPKNIHHIFWTCQME
jgi:hypothetical protein